MCAMTSSPDPALVGETSAPTPDFTEDLLSCPVCLDEYDDPRSLGCLHSFCKRCLDQVAQRCMDENNILPCPLCKLRTRLPPNGIEGLRKDFRISQMKSLIEKYRPLNPVAGAKTCDVCRGNDENLAAFHCSHCLVYFCEVCLEKHNQNPMFASHAVSALAQDTSYCSTHFGHAVRYVCECNPDVLLCAICVMSHDSEHELKTITKARLRLLQETLTNVKDTRAELQNHMVNIDHATVRYEAMLAEIKRDIRTQAQAIMELVAKKEADMMHAAEEEIQSTLTKYKMPDTLTHLRYTQNLENYLEHQIRKKDDNRYHRDRKIHQEFIKFRSSVRPKLFPKTGIRFVPYKMIPDINLGHFEGSVRADVRKNDGQGCKNRVLEPDNE